MSESPSQAHAQQELVLGRQEIVRQHCEITGKMFYSGVTHVDAIAVQAQYLILKLTPALMYSSEFIQALNADMDAGKLTLASITFGRPEHVRFLANYPDPILCLCVFRGPAHVSSHTHTRKIHTG
jgi:hypothetical protein